MENAATPEQIKSVVADVFGNPNNPNDHDFLMGQVGVASFLCRLAQEIHTVGETTFDYGKAQALLEEWGLPPIYVEHGLNY